MIVKTKPAHGYQSISMVDPSLVGVEADNINRPISRALELVAPYLPLDGMNEKGLSVGGCDWLINRQNKILGKKV